MLLAVLDDKFKNVTCDTVQWDHTVGVAVFDHVLYCLQLHRHALFYLKRIDDIVIFERYSSLQTLLTNAKFSFNYQ